MVTKASVCIALLFAKAMPSQARHIADVLQDFCAASGLKICLLKSKAYASKEVRQRRGDKLTQITQINFTNRIEKYLGFRLLQGRTSVPRRRITATS